MPTNAVAYDHIDPRTASAATACSLCNNAKGSYLLSELVSRGWPAAPRPVHAGTRWRGLAQHLSELRMRLMQRS